MKKTIWKYVIPPHLGGITHKMPKGAKILTISEQGGNGVIWALVDPNSPIEDITFDVFYTGQEFVPNHYREYIGTFTRPANEVVYHVFKRIEDA